MRYTAFYLAYVHSSALSQATFQCSPPIVNWAPCDEQITKNLECATFAVPLDHSRPYNNSVILSLARIKSVNRNPKGTVFLNPGGPGGSGVEMVQKIFQEPASQPHHLLQDYHLVGVDPRGVGNSAVKCDPVLWNKRLPFMIHTPAEYLTMVEHWGEIGRSCRNLTGLLIDHLDTIQTVHDFELLRQAVRSDKFNLIGLSYGSQIGYTYAEYYPSTVGRMALDGMLDHRNDKIYTVQTESLSFEQTLRRFFEWCRHTNDCALNGEESLEQSFSQLLDKARASPIPAPQCDQIPGKICHTTVTDEDILASVQGKLMNVAKTPLNKDPDWHDLAQALLKAFHGDASGLSAVYFTNSTMSAPDWTSLAVGCQDWNRAESFEDLAAVLTSGRALSPLTRGYTQGLSYVARCAKWPTLTSNGQQPLRASILSAPKMMFINSFWDPSTSLQWAASLWEGLPNSALVYRNGSGHTSYYIDGESTRAMNAFIMNGTIPTDGTVYLS